MARTTINAVNRAIIAAGGREELVRGHGYFYFANGDAHDWPASSVYVYALNSYSVSEWVERWRELRQAHLDRSPKA